MAATMAQSTFGLQPSTNDDTMEISSDLGNVDGDIDIDLDSAGEQMQFEDDDQMVDDVKTDPITHHDDDVMIDDEVTSNPGDREMQDDSVLPPQQEHDEELLDFSDDDDDTYANRAPPISAPAVPSLLSAAQSHVEPSAPIIQEPVQDHDTKSIQEHVTEASLATVQEPEDQVSSEAAAELVTEGAPVVDHISQHDEEHQQPQIVVAPEDQAQPTSQDAESVHEAAHIGHDGHAEAHAVGSPEPSVHQGEERYESVTEDVNEQPGDVDSFAEIVTQPLEQPAEPHAGGTAEPATNDDTSDRPEAGQTDGSGPDSHEVTRTLNVDTAPTNHGDADDAPAYERQPNSPTATGLHPTVVEYNENEIYLFPSSDPEATEQYLLGNENLVTSSLGDLLQACRSVLAESISDDEELVLGVQELDLYVSEDSTPAFSISFQELLDVYLQLHKHDGMVHPPPSA
ncbi:hypothetical protein AAFC00_000189 [Neodothiora populina]|uniref:Uncharacterized protein n=1 Tax=Neodothiora populina TaxID=2781224 RepID=A0ABR3P1Q1_9PEZI